MRGEFLARYRRKMRLLWPDGVRSFTPGRALYPQCGAVKTGGKHRLALASGFGKQRACRTGNEG